MAVEKSAVREGTRWGFRGQVVVVLEVSPRAHVVYAPYGKDAMVVSLARFLAEAFDPAALVQFDAPAEYRDLLADLTTASRETLGSRNEGVLLCLLRDSVLHLLHRAGEPSAAPDDDFRRRAGEALAERYGQHRPPVPAM